MTSIAAVGLLLIALVMYRQLPRRTQDGGYRLQEIEGERTMCEESLISQLENLQGELKSVKKELMQAKAERDEAQEKCAGMEELMTKMGLDSKATMEMVSCSINWGKDFSIATEKADEYSESMVKDIIIQEYKDKLKKLEEENKFQKEAMVTAEKITLPSETEKMVMNQHDIVSRYKQLLSESEQKLTEKSQEVAKLTSEIRQLKVRQEHLEELNLKCPTENLQKMVEEGRNKLSELMRKSLESEQKILQCENIIEKQSKQMNEMENLLRYRENMAGVLKASRDELLIEKDSLTRYSQEMRNALAEVTKESKMKERLIKELQEKIDFRERQINKLGKEVQDLENNLMMTNEKRYKLQETIGTMEKELQSTKAHFNEIADINTRYEPGMKHSCRNNSSKNSMFYEDVSKAYRLLQNYLDNYRPDTRNEPKINSKSLLGLSIKKVESLKSRLNYITKINALNKLSSSKFERTGNDALSNNSSSVTRICSKVSLTRSSRQKHLEKIVEITAKRYDYLQKQAYESYEELTSLVKLSVPSQNNVQVE